MDYNEDSEVDAAEGESNRHRSARVSRRLALHGVQENSDEQDYQEAGGEVEEDDDDEVDDEEEEEPTVSVSSRGRVRKIIAKARRLFRE